MRYIVFLSIFCLLPLLGVASEPQAVDVVGIDELQAITSLFQSNMGLFIGLTIAAIGFWTWLTSQSTFGIAMIFFGILVTAFPGMFESFRNGMFEVMKTAGGKPIKEVDFTK